MQYWAVRTNRMSILAKIMEELTSLSFDSQLWLDSQRLALIMAEESIAYCLPYHKFIEVLGHFLSVSYNLFERKLCSLECSSDIDIKSAALYFILMWSNSYACSDTLFQLTQKASITSILSRIHWGGTQTMIRYILLLTLQIHGVY